MPVSFLDLRSRPVQRPQPRPLRTLLKDAGMLAQSHRAAHLCLVNLEKCQSLCYSKASRTYLRHVYDDVVLGVGVQLLAPGVLDHGYVGRILDDGKLHAETDSEEWDLLGTRPIDGLDHSGRASNPEAAWNQDLRAELASKQA